MIIFFVSMSLSASFAYFLCYEGIAELCSFVVFIASIALCINFILRCKYLRRTLLLFILGLSVGYLAVTISLNWVEYQEKNEQIRHMETFRDKTAIVIMTEGEPEIYNIPICIKMIRNSCEDNRAIQTIKMPFELYKLKNYYRKFNTTKAPDIVKSIISKLQLSIDSDYDYYYCYTRTRPFIKERFLQLANMGYKKIIVINMFINESTEYKKALSDIDELALFEQGIKVTITYPMWNNRWVSKMYVHRVNSFISGSEMRDTGIVLLGDGTKSRSEQIILLNNIKQNLIVEGYRKSNIKISWLGKDVSMVKNATETLLNDGIGHICYIPCSFVLDNFLTKDVLTKAVNTMPRASKTHIVYIDAWNDDDMIIKSIIDTLNNMI